MKKILYVALFVVLGILLQQLVHAAIEMSYIALMVHDWPRYSFGWTYERWVLIHNVLSLLLFVGGVWWGIWVGRREWDSAKKK